MILLRRLAALAPGLVAAALASIAVRRSYSLGEIERVLTTRRSWRSLVPFDPADPSGALYNVALKGWLHVGSEEWVARAPSIAAFGLTATVVCLLGSRLFDRRVGLVAGTIFATTAFAVGAARQVDPVPLAVLAATSATWLFVCALEANALLLWAAYAATAVAAVYLHASSILVLAAHACAVAFRPGTQRRRSFAAAVSVGLLTVPAVAPAVVHRRHLLDGLSQPDLTDIGRALHAVTGRNGVLLALAAVGVVVLLLLHVPGGEAWKTTLLVSAALLPLTGALALSMVRPSLDVRYLAVSLPAWSLLAAAGLRMIRPEIGAVALAGLLAVAGLRLVDEVHSTPENWRAAVSAAFAAKAPDDRVVAAPRRALSAVAFYAGPNRGSVTPKGPAVFVLVRAHDQPMALDLGRRTVRPPAYALRDARRIGDALWLQRWERTGLRAR